MGVFEKVQLMILEKVANNQYLKVKRQVEMWSEISLKTREHLLEHVRAGKAEFSLEEAEKAASRSIKSFQADLDEMVDLKDMFVVGVESLRYHRVTECLLLIQDWRAYLSALEKKNKARSLWVRRAEFAPDGGGRWVEAEKDGRVKMVVIRKRILGRLGIEETLSKTDPTSEE